MTSAESAPCVRLPRAGILGRDADTFRSRHLDFCRHIGSWPWSSLHTPARRVRRDGVERSRTPRRHCCSQTPSSTEGVFRCCIWSKTPKFAESRAVKWCLNSWKPRVKGEAVIVLVPGTRGCQNGVSRDGGVSGDANPAV